MIVTDSERMELQRQSVSRNGRADAARHARLILLLAEGRTWAEIRAKLDCSDSYISRWSKRFATDRLAGLFARHSGGVCQSSSRLWSGGCLNLFGFGIPFGVEKYSVGKTPVAHATRPSRGIAHLGVFVERGRPSHQCLVLAPMPL